MLVVGQWSMCSWVPEKKGEERRQNGMCLGSFPRLGSLSFLESRPPALGMWLWFPSEQKASELAGRGGVLLPLCKECIACQRIEDSCEALRMSTLLVPGDCAAHKGNMLSQWTWTLQTLMRHAQTAINKQRETPMSILRNIWETPWEIQIQLR